MYVHHTCFSHMFITPLSQKNRNSPKVVTNIVLFIITLPTVHIILCSFTFLYSTSLHDYGRTSYLSPPPDTPNWIKDSTSWLTQLITEGQVTYPHLLTHPTDCGRTGYISPPPVSPNWLWKNRLHIPPPATTNWLHEDATDWLWKDRLHTPTSFHTHLVTGGQTDRHSLSAMFNYY